MYELKISRDRVGSLVGKKGETKKLIERSTKTKIKVSRDGDVIIEGEGLDAFICEKIVRAIGRGFNPNVALGLLSDNYSLEIVDIREFGGDSKKNLERIRARVIGSGGRARRVIEKLTECHICIYGKTVSIIGEINKLNVAYRGVIKLLSGSAHGNVYGFLEKEMKRIKVS